jgi:methyl-accepting chemotaxis protein
VVKSHVEGVYAVIGDSVINHQMDVTRKELDHLKATYEEDQVILKELADTDAEVKMAQEASDLYKKYLAMFENEFLPEVAPTTIVTDRARVIDGEMDEVRQQTLAKIGELLTSLRNEAEAGDQEFDATAKASILGSVIGSVLSVLVSILLAMTFANSLNAALQGVTEQVSELATRLMNSATQLSGATHQLSEANTEQAAAIQETSATMEQISAMIQKSSNNAEMSSQQARQSADFANRGEEASQKMIGSVQEIKSSHDRISQQVAESNEQISRIVDVIRDIGTKTKVINEIVFQTKLLSFNASVEAARAGEHGKGFAVVAEEVGSLAQMSGNAAKEITGLLEASIETVTSAVRESKERIGEIMHEGETVVVNGERVARETGSQLQEISRSISVVNQNSEAIAQASREQAQGVVQISEALSQLDKATHQNATVAKQVSVSADEVSDFSRKLSANMEELSALVRGRSA